MTITYEEHFDAAGNSRMVEKTLFGLVPADWSDMLVDADEYDRRDTRGSCYDLQEVINKGTAERAAQVAAAEAAKEMTRDFSAMMGPVVERTKQMVVIETAMTTRDFSAMMGQGAGVSNNGVSFEQTFPGKKPEVCEYECFEGVVWQEMPAKPKKRGGFWPAGCAVSGCKCIHKIDPAASWVVVDTTSPRGYTIVLPK
jgi:hypothetical protein